jgi:hypothetical protein
MKGQEDIVKKINTGKWILDLLSVAMLGMLGMPVRNAGWIVQWFPPIDMAWPSVPFPGIRSLLVSFLKEEKIIICHHGMWLMKAAPVFTGKRWKPRS